MIKYLAEKGIKPNIKIVSFNSLKQLKNSNFNYDYYHKIDILETHMSERYKKRMVKFQNN